MEFWNPNCDKCGGDRKMDEKYDSYYCENCNIWLEAKCDDPDCDLCIERPEYPNS